MKIWRNIKEFNARNPVITIGIFDGVHRGHQFLIEELKNQAVQRKGESAVLTLWPHPRLVLNKDPENLRYLTTIEEKAYLLEKEGIDHFVIIPFTKEFSKLNSCDFVEEYLVKKLKIKKLLIGFNHKFGRNREGDYQNLKDCAKRFSFELERLKPVEVEGERISSSIIRELLTEGELEKANSFLGYDFFLRGKVIEGNKLGRKIGYPTANIQPYDEHKLIPKIGVYAVQVEYRDRFFSGMLNIGYRPTVNSDNLGKTIEVHLFDYEGDMYNSEVKLYFRSFMREEKKFESLKQLTDQLHSDKSKAIEILRYFK